MSSAPLILIIGMLNHLRNYKKCGKLYSRTNEQMIDRMQITFINMGLKEVDQGVITFNEYKALRLIVLGEDYGKS